MAIPTGRVDCYWWWTCGRCTLSGVLVLSVWCSWWCVGGWRDNTACVVIACSPSLHHAPRRRFDSSAAAFSTFPTHPGAALETVLVCMSRTSPSGVGRGIPPRFVSCPGANVPGTLGGTGTSVGYYGEPGVLRDHGGSGCLYPFGTGGYPACYQCGVASAQCGGIGSPGAVVPLCQVTLLASSPSLHHAYYGSLVTPSVCFWTSPYPCA